MFTAIGGEPDGMAISGDLQKDNRLIIGILVASGTN
jgi:hypothetical protein